MFLSNQVTKRIEGNRRKSTGTNPETEILLSREPKNLTYTHVTHLERIKCSLLLRPPPFIQFKLHGADPRSLETLATSFLKVATNPHAFFSFQLAKSLTISRSLSPLMYSEYNASMCP